MEYYNTKLYLCTYLFKNVFYCTEIYLNRQKDKTKQSSKIMAPTYLSNYYSPTLVGKSARNSAGFRDYSNSGPFELQNFYRNFIFPIVKCVPANLKHVPAGLESSPTIDSSDFMNRKMFPLYMSVASGIKF
jgi:hypothetical protein